MLRATPARGVLLALACAGTLGACGPSPAVNRTAARAADTDRIGLADTRRNAAPAGATSRADPQSPALSATRPTGLPPGAMTLEELIDRQNGSARAAAKAATVSPFGAD